jgi:ribonuclease HI
MSSKQQKYYAVARGRIPGIYTEWDSCQIQVDGFTGARCKKFATEAEAKEFVKNYGILSKYLNTARKYSDVKELKLAAILESM